MGLYGNLAGYQRFLNVNQAIGQNREGLCMLAMLNIQLNLLIRFEGP